MSKVLYGDLSLYITFQVVAIKPSPAVITSAVSAWSFLLTTMNGWTLNPKTWQEWVTSSPLDFYLPAFYLLGVWILHLDHVMVPVNIFDILLDDIFLTQNLCKCKLEDFLTYFWHWCRSISYLSSLLDKDDRSIRIAAGEGLALIFEIGNLEKFSVAATGPSDSSNHDEKSAREFTHIQGLRAKILNQVRSLSVEAGGKGSAKKDLNSQRNTFRDILEFLEVFLFNLFLILKLSKGVLIVFLFIQDGFSPETSMKIGGESLSTTSWSELIQVALLLSWWRFHDLFINSFSSVLYLLSLNS